MDNIRITLRTLCQEMTVSGYEYRAERMIRELCSPFFDEIKMDHLGNFVMIKKSGKENAPKILLDAHFDNVGMMVTSIENGGFLGITSIGGIDTRVLPATEVTVYGAKEIYGIISSTPPHLLKGGSGTAPGISELWIDTGYSKEELEKYVEIGDIVGYRNKYTELHNNFVTSAGLDDKACVCGIIEAMRLVDASKLSYDVYVTISAQEETGKCGSARATFGLNPDIAIITDVNFARGDGSPDHETIVCGEGVSVDISSATDRRLTRNIIKLLTEVGIAHQLICEPDCTYTNNERLLVNGLGTRTAVISIPLKSMHTPSETVKLEDIVSLRDVILAILYADKEAL
ncbi:MAG: M20/M25/M40 family metallo-hydrolase [Clostridia bacterium]|nr:M20/M25/M40 family metallo-hydrolase [Clostridia bacterium]